MTVILSGASRVTQRAVTGAPRADRHARARRRSWASSRSSRAGRRWSTPMRQAPVEALVIPPERLRALLIAEAELGERIMRALILRRVGLLESGAPDPVIVGRADNGDVLRLENFLRAQRPSAAARSIPDTDRRAKALIERFHVDRGRAADRALPGRADCCAIPSEIELARCLGLVAPLDAGQALRRRDRRRRPGRARDGGLRGVRGSLGRSCSTAARSAARPAPRRGSRTTSAFRPASRGMALMARAYNQAQKFGAEMAIPDEVGRLHAHADGGSALRRCVSRAASACSARAVVIASGARYRRLDVDEPRRVRGDAACTTGPRRSRQRSAPSRRWRWSAPATRPARRSSTSRARRRRSGCWCAAPSLEASMSRYLVDRIGGAAERRGGDAARRSRRSKAATACSRRSAGASGGGEETQRPIRHLFLFIGADPNTDWLAGLRRRARREGLRPHRRGRGRGRRAARDEPSRRLRHRRRARGLGEARRRGGRRGRAGRRGAARFSRRSREAAPAASTTH